MRPLRLAPWNETAVLSQIWRFIVAGYNKTAVKIVLGSSQGTLDGLSEFGARGELHLKRRSFARRRHHPDAAAVHLHDLLGDGEAEARAALGLGKGAVNLVELIEDPTLLVERYAGPGVCYGDGEMAVPRARCNAHLAGVGELDGVANEIEQHLCEALLISEANRERLVHGRLERELLVLGERLGGRAHRLHHALDGVFGHV